MRRLSMGAIATLVAVAGALGFTGGVAGATAPNPTSQVSVAHGILEVPVDVYVNDSLAIPDFQPTEIVSNLALSAGDYDIDLVAEGGDPSAPIYSETVTVPAPGLSITLLAHLTDTGAPDITAFVNDTSALPADTGRAVLGHAAFAPPVTVTINGAEYLTDFANGDTEVGELPAGTVEASVFVPGPTPVVAIPPSPLTITAGTLTNAFVVSNLAGDQFGVVAQVMELGSGYGGVAADGGFFNFGTQSFVGSAATVPLVSPIVDAAATSDGLGAVLVAADGGIFTLGTAAFYGSGVGAATSAAASVGMLPDDSGYYLVQDDGKVWPFGAAESFGDGEGAATAPIVDIVVTTTGEGYYLVQEDGKVWAFGDAADIGDVEGLPQAPIVAAVATPTGAGLTLVGSDGATFALGDADFLGSLAGVPLNAPIVGAKAAPNGYGIVLGAADGGFFTFGDYGFYGSLGDITLNQPVVAVV